MGCACEDGSQDRFIGVITKVNDLSEIEKMLGTMKEQVPVFHAELVKQLEALRAKGEDLEKRFSLLVRTEHGAEMSMSGDLFPQDKEWAQAHVGKPLLFTMVQLPKQGGVSWDVALLGHESSE